MSRRIILSDSESERSGDGKNSPSRGGGESEDVNTNELTLSKKILKEARKFKKAYLTYSSYKTINEVDKSATSHKQEEWIDKGLEDFSKRDFDKMLDKAQDLIKDTKNDSTLSKVRDAISQQNCLLKKLHYLINKIDELEEIIVDLDKSINENNNTKDSEGTATDNCRDETQNSNSNCENDCTQSEVRDAKSERDRIFHKLNYLIKTIDKAKETIDYISKLIIECKLTKHSAETSVNASVGGNPSCKDIENPTGSCGSFRSGQDSPEAAPGDSTDDSEPETAMKELKKAKGKLEEAKGKLEEAEGKLEEAKKELGDEKKKVDEAEGKLKKAKGKIQKAKGKVEKAKGKVEKAEGKVEKAKKGLKRTEENDEVEILKRAVKQCDEEVDNYAKDAIGIELTNWRQKAVLYCASVALVLLFGAPLFKQMGISLLSMYNVHLLGVLRQAKLLKNSVNLIIALRTILLPMFTAVLAAFTTVSDWRVKRIDALLDDCDDTQKKLLKQSHYYVIKKSWPGVFMALTVITTLCTAMSALLNI